MSRTATAHLRSADPAIRRGDGRSASSGLRQLCELLDGMGARLEASRQRGIESRADALDRVFTALACVRRAGDSSEVLACAPRQLSVAGDFDRTMVSRIEGSTWTPTGLHIARGEDAAANLALGTFIDGLEIPLTSSMVETELVRKGLPVLVSDPQRDARTYRPLMAVSRTEAYVVAPIAVDGTVVGLLHADNFASGRDLTSADRDVVRTFADGVGLIYETALIIERLAMQREQIDAALAAAGSVVGRLHTPGGLVPAWSRSGVPASPRGDRAERALDRSSRLTEREQDVLELIARGSTNGQIARTLCVSESTVKSHVKHIFKKLGATTRAEVIARRIRALDADEQRAS